MGLRPTAKPRQSLGGWATPSSFASLRQTYKPRLIRGEPSLREEPPLHSSAYKFGFATSVGLRPSAPPGQGPLGQRGFAPVTLRAYRPRGASPLLFPWATTWPRQGFALGRATPCSDKGRGFAPCSFTFTGKNERITLIFYRKARKYGIIAQIIAHFKK